MDDLKLNPEKILELEFQYAQSTAKQAQDDRTTILNLYLLLVGGVGSIVIALPSLSQAQGFSVPRGTYALLFALLALTGLFVVAKLIRLRQAWYDSALAMNRIKDFYVAEFPTLASALRWRTQTIPPPGKPWTITFNLALLVAIIDSVALAVAVYFTGVRLPLGEYALAGCAAAIFFLWQAWLYFFQLPLSADDH